MLQGLRNSVGRWRALRELRLEAARYSANHQHLFKERISLALETVANGDRKKALSIWEEVRTLFPDRIPTYEPALRLLLDLGAFDEADAVMQEGMRRHPSMEHFARGHVQIAHRQKDLCETLRRCDVVRKRFPRIPEAYTAAADCLRQLGRGDEAELMIEKALRRLPDTFDVVVAHARWAVSRKDWPEALRRWQRVTRDFDHFLGPTGVAQALREMGRYDEAEEVASKACDRFPRQTWPFAEWASVAAARGDTEIAMERWCSVRRKFPYFAYAHVFGAAVARQSGRDAEADEILTKAVARFRSDLSIHLEYARSADRRSNWEAAVERWALIRERFPDCAEARDCHTKAVAELGRQTGTAEDRSNPPSKL